MAARLRDLYGRRITPVTRIFILIAIILLGLRVAYNGNSSDKKRTDKTIIE